MLIDFVTQATGNHAWAVEGGWIHAAKSLGICGNVFKPRASWGSFDCHDDDGLLEYLKSPTSDAILLLGFDWHSQMLHNSSKWREAWKNRSIIKVLYTQESIKNTCQVLSNNLPLKSLQSAAEIADLIIFTDSLDADIFRNLGVPSIWQPFGVDTQVFYQKSPFLDRKKRAFFRGQVNPYGGKAYDKRRELLNYLITKQAIDVIQYSNKPLSADEIVQDYNRYQIVVNFPSIFTGHPTRVYEALACGCALITNRTGIDRFDSQFTHGLDLLYYTNKDELLGQIQKLESDTSYAQQLAANGMQKVISYHSSQKRLLSIASLLDLFH